MTIEVTGFTTTMSIELFHLMVGKQLGSGIGRRVYEYAHDDKLVIKFEDNQHSFQNIREWENWQTFNHAPKVRRWLAPCVAISPCGCILLQKKTKPLEMGHPKLPKMLPKFLTDRKVQNFGLLDNRLVCHDYAILVTEASHRQTKAGWW